MARKSSYDPKFHPKNLIELMSQGLFNVQIYAAWDVGKDTFYRWIRENPELDEAYQRGLPKCEAYWIEHRFKPMIEGKLEGKHSFNATMAMANAKFGYRNNQDNNAHNSTTNISIGQVNVLNQKAP